MRIWIDATDPCSELQVFGMPLLERQLQAIIEAGLEPSQVCVELSTTTHGLSSLPARILKRLPLRWIQATGSLSERLALAVREAQDEPLIALVAESIVDVRLLQYLKTQTGPLTVRGGTGDARTAVIRFEGNSPVIDAATASLPQLADAGIQQGVLREVSLEEVPSYIKKLRRDLPVYLLHIADTASRDEAERFLFRSNYKGSTDFFTKYVYPPLVWRVVRPLARWRVHPNVVTLFNVFITFAAVPLFAQGYWFTGFLLAYTMSVLDSVDGKLARLTFRASRIGDLLDHGLDIIHPPLWYWAWAWALSDGDTTALVFQAVIWMVGFYILDRLVIALFNLRLGRSIHGYTPFDVRMRTFISRRNINLPVFMLGVILGLPVLAFYLIVLWQVATFIFHTARLFHFWNSNEVQSVAGKQLHESRKISSL